jgi:3-oxoacyl-[acyl-carrier protein] reductase
MNILVTGGSKGLGAAIVKKLLTEPGNHIYFTYYQSSLSAREVEKQYPNVTPIYCDFNDDVTVQQLAKNIQELDIDILINTVAISFPKNHFHKVESNVFLESFKINILNTIVITQSAIKYFRKKKDGRIITILSSAILNKPPIGWSEYVANKNYLLSLSNSWATENISYNISSNCISPSFMLTDYNSDVDERVIEGIINSHPLKKLLTVDEVAFTVEFLTKCSKQINGININMNAGSSL